MQATHDIIVIGGGPAGISAAVAASRVNRTVALFDSQEYRNEKAQEMHNVLIHDGENPAQYRAAAMGSLLKYQTVTRVQKKVVKVKKTTLQGNREGFEAVDSSGSVFVSFKLILATGSRDVMPDIPGYSDLWGRTILHCVFCDGLERTRGPVGVLGYNTMNEMLTAMMAVRLAEPSVTIYTNGATNETDEYQRKITLARNRGCRIEDRQVSRLTPGPNGAGIEVHFADGSSDVLTFLLSQPPTANRAQDLMDSLGIAVATDKGGCAKVQDMFQESTVRGCFVAGDTSTPFKIVSIATSTGTLAGMGASMQLAMDDAEGAQS